MPLLAETSSLPAWGIVLAVAAVLAVWAAGVFNGLTRKRNGYRNAFAQIDVQLKRRYDLVPNLVETVKGYAKHERETLEAVVKARNVAAAAAEAAAKAAGDPDAMARLAHSEAALGGALSRLLVTVERYPEQRRRHRVQQRAFRLPCGSARRRVRLPRGEAARGRERRDPRGAEGLVLARRSQVAGPRSQVAGRPET